MMTSRRRTQTRLSVAPESTSAAEPTDHRKPSEQFRHLKSGGAGKQQTTTANQYHDEPDQEQEQEQNNNNINNAPDSNIKNNSELVLSNMTECEKSAPSNCLNDNENDGGATAQRSQEKPQATRIAAEVLKNQAKDSAAATATVTSDTATVMMLEVNDAAGGDAGKQEESCVGFEGTTGAAAASQAPDSAASEVEQPRAGAAEGSARDPAADKVEATRRHHHQQQQQQLAVQTTSNADADDKLKLKEHSSWHQSASSQSPFRRDPEKANLNSAVALDLDPEQRSGAGDTSQQASKQTSNQQQVDAQHHHHHQQHHHQHQHQHSRDLNPIAANSNRQNFQYSKQRHHHLSYLQSLLLRHWPCLPMTICIMSSLIFSISLCLLTIYVTHQVDCGGQSLAAAAISSASTGPHVAAAAAATAAAATSTNLQHHHFGGSIEPNNPAHHALLSPPDTPIEQAAGVGVAAADAPMEPALMARNMGPSGGAVEPVGLESSKKQTFERLPGTVLPQHYDLFIWPNIAAPKFDFKGHVSIWIKSVGEPTRNITLHTNELGLDEATLKLELANNGSSSGSSSTATNNKSNQTNETIRRATPKVTKLSQDKQLQYSIIHLDGELEPGRDYVLSIDFTGLLNDDLAGFYKIKYERQNSSEPTWIAATQFQATDARRAFPCFDEPLYKATFSISIKHWRNMTALSNMPIARSELSTDGLWLTDSFEKSHRMSTYLVAFAVTNFESRSEGNISVWTRPGLVHTADFALKIAGKILRHYEEFFGIKYPLPKMDMIALPDFNAGAMENWGLITYRETAMLYDPTTSSIANKQRVAVVVAHELAHQWFGNLVTPKWWDDLWLNEGFASYVEYIGVNFVEPKWKMLDQFVVEEVQNVFKVDALSSSHQISIPVSNPDEISEIFDHISYAKGASIIRMMIYFLGEPVFMHGLRSYLKALKYGNAEQSDLWAHLTDAQHLFGQQGLNVSQLAEPPIEVERVMNSWTLQAGYPLVSLTRSYDGKRTASLAQARYQPYKTSPSQAANEQKWDIPITLTWRSEKNWQPKTRFWMHQNSSKQLQVPTGMVPQSDADWMIVNLNQVGYYRVNYDLKNWQLLIDQLNNDHKQIQTTNRAQLLDDMFELAKSSRLDYRFAMEATKYLKLEQDYLPWDTVLMSFAYIDDMLQRTPIYGDWKDYLADLIEPYYARYKNLDWTDAANATRSQNSQHHQQLRHLLTTGSQPPSPTARDGKTNDTATMEANDILEQYNLVNAVAWACQVNQHCIERAKSLFKKWRETGQNSIFPALRYTVYCTAIENGNKDDWNFLWQMYEKEQSASERDRVMRALGCSKEMWILSRYLEWTFSKTKPIRRQDGAYVFRMIAKNNYGRDIAFNFMRERWSTIKEYYGKISFSLGSLIRSISTSMNTQTELNEFQTFYEKIKADVGTGKRSFQIAIEEVEGNMNWRNKNYKVLEDWLQEQKALSAFKSSNQWLS